MFSSSTSLSSGGRPTLTLGPQDVPPLPAALAEILLVANDPEVSLASLQRVIMRDQSLALRVLTVANSSYYGASRQIESVRGAVALLGTRQVQNVASALALAPSFESEHGPGLWRHGLACALWTDKVVAQLGLPSIDSLFTSALMHDIGIVMLLARASDRALPCIELARTSGRPLVECERELLGWDHAELGARVCENWRLPGRISQLIAIHEQPPGRDDIAHAVLSLADELARGH
ncbi:MAG: HDOD domain-containing protein, partial [Deltaproteobacteria bacterium]|nr:HDOD domain-containing protein [Nannocystaceae bacterium]